MVEAWRIVKTRHSATAFDGEGARLYGGRWNSIGVPMVYTAATISLAMMEMLVHLDQSAASLGYSLIRVEIDADLISQLDTAQLPTHWTEPSAANQLKAIGDSWVAEGSSVVLKVPSAVVPQESCYLINPIHPDFRKLKIHRPQPTWFDPRLKS